VHNVLNEVYNFNSRKKLVQKSKIFLTFADFLFRSLWVSFYLIFLLVEFNGSELAKKTKRGKTRKKIEKSKWYVPLFRARNALSWSPSTSSHFIKTSPCD